MLRSLASALTKITGHLDTLATHGLGFRYPVISTTGQNATCCQSWNHLFTISAVESQSFIEFAEWMEALLISNP